MRKIKKVPGFTIVELLIVVVIIGILAAIVVVAYNGIQNRARVSSANSDVATLQKAIIAARINADKVLLDITGSGCTRCSGTQSRYELTLDRISSASGMNLNNLKSGDPWGNMYAIDENEGEGTTPCSNKDSIVLSPGRTGVNGVLVPFYSCPN